MFDSYIERLLRSGHACSIATHDVDRLDHLDRLVRDEKLHDQPYYVEMLTGLDAGELGRMRHRGHPAQEDIVYGTEWWLYVCNRIAEDPHRLFDALVDLAG